MRIILVRHGETAWNAEGRLQGWKDVPLSEAGRTQAKVLGSRLACQPIHRALASSLARAEETARLVLGARASMLSLDPDLRELNHGAWEGLRVVEVAEAYPKSRAAWRDTPHLSRPDGGESLQEVQDRAWPVVERAMEGLGPEDVLLVVTHDIVVRVILAKVLGLPFSRIWSFRLAPTSVNLLEGPRPEQLSLVRLNDATHLTPMFGEAVHRQL